MNKAEKFFKKVDFSVETDLKERLRKQLFGNSEIVTSEQETKDGSADGIKRRGSARELSFDELEMVNAAGNIAMQEHNIAMQEHNFINKAKLKPVQDRPDPNPWNNTFSGNITDDDVK